MGCKVSEVQILSPRSCIVGSCSIISFLARIIHQPPKWTRASAFDVRITLRATASQEHLAPQTSPSGCPDSAQMGRTFAIGHTSASQPAWAYNERVALEPLTLS